VKGRASIGIVIPVKNESQTIAKVVEGCNPWGKVYVVLDDGTQDDTASVAEKAGAEVLHSATSGLAPSLLKGLQHCSTSHGLVIVLDAGNSHRAEDIPILLSKNSSLVIGSRFLAESLFNQVWYRKLLTYTASLLLALPFKSWGDFTSGYRCYDANMLRTLIDNGVFEKINSQDRAVQFELLWWIKRLGFSWAFAPIHYEGSTSSVNRGKILEALRIWWHLLLRGDSL